MKMHKFLQGKKSKVNYFWILYGAVLVILFLLSSTDLIIKEEETEVYPISVIIEDVSDENYVNFRKGMERAAMENNVDASFITLYERGNARQQRELILREQEDGSRALIVAPVEDELLAAMQQENLLSLPVVCVNTEREKVMELDNTAVLTFDYYDMGCRMGEEIRKEHPAAGTVYLLKREETAIADDLFSKGIEEALGRAGELEISSVILNESSMMQILTEPGGGGGKGIILVALDPESLLQAVQLLGDPDQEGASVEGLYGRGNTVSLLNYLDKGMIQGLCVTDDFSAGYLSVKAAVELSENHSVEHMGYLESYFIRREDLRNEKYEKMLYPIE